MKETIKGYQIISLSMNKPIRYVENEVNKTNECLKD